MAPDNNKLEERKKATVSLHQAFRDEMKAQGRVSVDSYFLKEDILKIKELARNRYPNLRISDAIGRYVSDEIL